MSPMAAGNTGCGGVPVTCPRFLYPAVVGVGLFIGQLVAIFGIALSYGLLVLGVASAVWAARGELVSRLAGRVRVHDADEVMGVDTPQALARAEAVVSRQKGGVGRTAQS